MRVQRNLPPQRQCKHEKGTKSQSCKCEPRKHNQEKEKETAHVCHTLGPGEGLWGEPSGIRCRHRTTTVQAPLWKDHREENA